MDFNFIGTIWSLLPPVVAIGLALKTKEVYSSLFIGIVLGAILYSMSMGTGLEGFLTHLLNDTVGTGTDAKHYGLISWNGKNRETRTGQENTVRSMNGSWNC